MRLFFGILLMLTMVGALQSCKEGCKDKSALNYDSKASQENGTCMYCTNAFVADTATYFFAISDSFGVNNGNSIEFIVTTTNSSISGNGCKSVGKQVANHCYNYVSIVNLTPKHAEGFIEAGFVQNGTDAWVFQNPQSMLLGPPGSGTDTLNFGLVDTTTCSNLTTGTMNVFNAQLQFF